MVVVGPSPRMWGLLNLKTPKGGRKRSIPTHVGFTTRAGSWRSPSTRSIPTHVGFTPTPHALLTKTAVHPHACGVYFLDRDKSSMSDGPSPRMWGLPMGYHKLITYIRSIPTHVGFTPIGNILVAPVSVHPHACGVYSGSGCCCCQFIGPSPRMWGLHPLLLVGVVALRSIPTHVGFTHIRRDGGEGISVHPHACGVYVSVVEDYDAYSGPSPRMWGLRLFPAKLRAPRPVHPHACGVYASRSERELPTPGPSPRMWGLLQDRAFPRLWLRSIPTHVGFTW